jgi:hypothetical protein
VLNVGQDDEVAFVVVENLPGRTLAQAVSGTPLPAAEARRLVGEVAEALAGAADRGLHHQRLAPEALVVDTNGSVKLTGTAVEAVAVGTESRDRDAASQIDALGLVCVLYAALTGRWPGTTPSDLPTAPQVGGRPVAPADLVAGVPADLDELCTQTLGNNGQDAPASPAEVARRLAPWPVTQPLTDPRGLLLTAPAEPGSSSTGAPIESPATATAEPSTEVAGAVASRSGVTGYLPARAPKAVDPETLPPGSFQGWSDLSTIGIPVAAEEPLVPFAPALMAEKPARDETLFVIRLVLGFVFLVLVVAAVSLRTLGSPTDLIPRDDPRPIPVVSATTSTPTPASPTPTPTPTPTPSAVVTPSSPPQIVGAQAIDPQGDGSENNDQTGRAVDNDSSTRWKSNHYSDENFGGLKKGVGLVLNLGGGAVPTVQQVIVEVAGSGGTVELRTTPGPGLDGSAVVAQAPIMNGRAALTPSKPVNSRLLLLWFTKLPKTDGKYQLLVSEINVR